jgi:hypothetical protein
MGAEVAGRDRRDRSADPQPTVRAGTAPAGWAIICAATLQMI